MHGTFAVKEGPVGEVGMHGTFAGQKAWTWWKRRGKCIVCEKKWFKLSTQLEKLGKYEDGRDSCPGDMLLLRTEETLQCVNQEIQGRGTD